MAAGEIHYYVAGSGGGFGGFSRRIGSGVPSGSGSGFGGLRGFGGGPAGAPARSGSRGPGGGAAGGPGGSNSTSAITSWVKAHYKSQTIGGQKVYNLTEPLG